MLNRAAWSLKMTIGFEKRLNLKTWQLERWSDMTYLV